MNIYLDTVGCRLNQSEIEKMGNQLRAAGHTLVDQCSLADLVIVNTCAVTTEAASDSRQKIRQAGRSGAARIIVTGCWATLDPDGAKVLPSVSQVVTNLDKDRLIPDILQISGVETTRRPIPRIPLPGIHQRTRAFIKAQDGCDNACTYCITHIVRGAGKSQPVEDILEDIQAAIDGGALEAVLTGVHLGSWGHDLNSGQNLADLVAMILEKSKIARLRLSSVEPWDLDEDFFQLFQNQRLCRHLHLPLQSGSANTLRRMGRRVTPDGYAKLIKTAREHVPDIAVTTDVMVGFPGESPVDFEESQQFVQMMGFSAGHVFNFSARPGTPAATFPDQVEPAVRKQRSRLVRSILAKTSLDYRQHFIGKTMGVLWEKHQPSEENNWLLEGLTDNYLRVQAKSTLPLWNKISQVDIVETFSGGLKGKIRE